MWFDLCASGYNQKFDTHLCSSHTLEHRDQMHHEKDRRSSAKITSVCIGTDPNNRSLFKLWFLQSYVLTLWRWMRLTPAAGWSSAAAAGWRRAERETRGWPQSVPARASRIRSDAEEAQGSGAGKRPRERHGRRPSPAGPASYDWTERSDYPADTRVHTRRHTTAVCRRPLHLVTCD